MNVCVSATVKTSMQTPCHSLLVDEKERERERERLTVMTVGGGGNIFSKLFSHFFAGNVGNALHGNHNMCKDRIRGCGTGPADLATAGQMFGFIDLKLIQNVATPFIELLSTQST